MDLLDLSAFEIAEKVKTKEICAQEVLDAYLSKAVDLNPEIFAFIEILEPDARFLASRIDAAVMRGEDPGVLAGVLVAVKDNINVKDTRCTCGSKILQGYVSPYDATAIARLRQEGAVILGKANLDEFAIGSSTETSFFGPTSNPWDLSRVAGGSSGGCAAAVSAGMAPLALGSDTGGSVRQPAAFTGICGMKPTYGLVSRYGLTAYASSFDQIGPMATSVEDCSLILDVIKGRDEADPTSSFREFDPFTKNLGTRTFKGLRVGIPEEFFKAEIDRGVLDRFWGAVSTMESLGAEVRYVNLPHLDYSLEAYKAIAYSEGSSNLSRFDGVRYGFRAPSQNLDEMYRETRGQGFGGEVKRSILLGTLLLSPRYKDALYGKALQVKALLKRDFRLAFERFHILVSPTTPNLPFKKGERAADFLSGYKDDMFTAPVNVAGIPAISIPCGLALPKGSVDEPDALPVGFQIMGKEFDDGMVLEVAYALEEALGDDFSMKRRDMRGRLRAKKECESGV